MVRITAVLTLLAMTTGCPSREVAKVDPRPNRETLKDIPVSINRDIDILFVIDDSGSMEEEQTSLINNFSNFTNVLETIEGGLPNVHIGIVNTDVGAGNYGIGGCSGNGENGALLNKSGSCGFSAKYIEDLDANGDGTRETNYSGTLGDAFSCAAELGITGCGFEQPLESAKRALNGSNPANDGFLRDNAFLAIIFITDEDDCSTFDTTMFDTAQDAINTPLGFHSSFRCFEFGVECSPDTPRTPGARVDCVPRTASDYMSDVNDYVEFFKGLKDDPSLLIMAGIMGNPDPVVVGLNDNNEPELEPSCSSANGSAAPAVRMKAFLDQFPGRNTQTTICNDNLSDALTQIADLLAEVIGNPCMDAYLRDYDEDQAGIQAVCEVSDVRFPGQDNQTEETIPQCACAADNSCPAPDQADTITSGIPCWYLATDQATCCPDNDCDDNEMQTLVVARGGASVPTGTHVFARCEAE